MHIDKLLTHISKIGVPASKPLANASNFSHVRASKFEVGLHHLRFLFAGFFGLRELDLGPKELRGITP